MASNEDDFALPGDEVQSQNQLPQQQQQQQQQVSATKAAGAISFSTHRYIPKVSVPIHSHSLHLTSINSKKVPVGIFGGDEENEGYGDAFVPTGVNRHSHCFVDDCPGSNPFDPALPPEDDDTVRDDNPSSMSHPATSASHLEHQQQRQLQQHQSSHIDSKCREQDELSDGESPYVYNMGSKRSRTALTVPSSGDYRKDREEWSDSAIGCLLDAYTEKYTQLNRGNLRGRDWEDVATTVSERCDKQKLGKTVEQCKNKVDNLKKRYKVEFQRLSSGNLAVSHWPWFKKMEHIIGSSSFSKPVPVEDKAAALGNATISLRSIKRYPATSPVSDRITSCYKMKSLSYPRWKRVVLKISSAALAGTGPHNVDPKVMMLIAKEVAVANSVGIEVAIVVGGRNFFCGDTWVSSTGAHRATTYQIGMMASAMNAILLQSSLEKIGLETRVQTAFMPQEVAEPYIRRRAIHHLQKGRVVIFGGISAGTVNALFTSDTAAALRASEINADAVLKGTGTDCAYGSHSRNSCSSFEHISSGELVSRGFMAMDMTAISFCEENNIPVVIFNLMEPRNISRALCGDQVGILIDQSGRIS